MENMSKSQKGCLIAVGALGIITLLTVIGAFILFQKAKNVVEDYADAFGASPEMIEEAKTLNELYPFEKPENEAITEEQLQRFIAVKKEFAQEVKDHESDLRALEGSELEGEAGFREFRKTLKILAEIRRHFLDALKKHQMSPKEYRFLSEGIYKSYFGSLIEHIQYDSLKMDEAGTEVNPQNIDLLNKYRHQLQELETLGFEFWGFGIFGIE
jgi:hypothetical protein